MDKAKHPSPKKSEISSNSSDLTSYAAESRDNTEEQSCEKSKLESSTIDGESREAIYRKIMHNITQSFDKQIREKMSRLFLFIVNFGSHMITFNSAGNVLIRNHILHPRSNILDLLHASISTVSPKPIGFKDFNQALVQINVPKQFLKVVDSKKKTSPMRAVDNQSIVDGKKIKWQTY